MCNCKKGKSKEIQKAIEDAMASVNIEDNLMSVPDEPDEINNDLAFFGDDDDYVILVPSTGRATLYEENGIEAHNNLQGVFPTMIDFVTLGHLYRGSSKKGGQG